MDCSPPSSSVHGILQAGILQWVTIPSSRGSSQPRLTKNKNKPTDTNIASGGTGIWCNASNRLFSDAPLINSEIGSHLMSYTSYIWWNTLPDAHETAIMWQARGLILYTHFLLILTVTPSSNQHCHFKMRNGDLAFLRQWQNYNCMLQYGRNMWSHRFCFPWYPILATVLLFCVMCL